MRCVFSVHNVVEAYPRILICFVFIALFSIGLLGSCEFLEMEKILAALANLGLTAKVHEHQECTSHDEHVR